jgi:hypothetical protein
MLFLASLILIDILLVLYRRPKIAMAVEVVPLENK